MRSRKFPFQAVFLVLLATLIAFALQGCVIHSHHHPNARYKTKTHPNKKYHRHSHDRGIAQEPAPEYVKKLPSKKQNPSSTNKPPPHARAYEVARGKPFINGNPPSSNGKNNGTNQGKTIKKSVLPTYKKNDTQESNQNKEKPLWGDESFPQQAKKESSPGKPIKLKDASEKGKEKSKGNPKEPLGNSSDQQNIIEESFSSPSEEFQIAKAKPTRDKSKKFPKGKKINHRKNKQQRNTSATVEDQEPVSGKAPTQPVTTTASYEPLGFDEDQRITIQSYYKKPGKKKGKQNKKSKGRAASKVTKNDILTQTAKSLPKKLESQLPPLPPNTQRVYFNKQVLLLERSTNRVLDVINLND